MIELDLTSQGRYVLSKFLGKFKINGFIDAIGLRGYHFDDDDTGIGTFGVRLRGYTGGNIDMEVPLSFCTKDGSINDPVFGFIDGKSVAITQGTFDRIFSSLNLERKMSPGWMYMSTPYDEFTAVKMNDSNKYKVASTMIGDDELGEAFENFMLCAAASLNTVETAIRNRIQALDDIGLSGGSIKLNLYVNFLGVVSKDTLDRLVEETVGNTPFKGNASVVAKVVRSADDVKMPILPFGGDIKEELDAYEGIDPDESDVRYNFDPAQTDPFNEPALEETDLQNMSDENFYEVPEPVDMAPKDVVEIVEVPDIYQPSHSSVTPEDIINIIKLLHILKFPYQKLDGDSAIRTTDPHYVWNTKNNKMILIGWDRDRGDWRSYDLSRMGDNDAVQVSFDNDWVSLGKFLDMVSKMEPSLERTEILENYTDQFIPQAGKPLYHEIRQFRGFAIRDLNKLRPRYGFLVQKKIDCMIDFLRGI